MRGRFALLFLFAAMHPAWSTTMTATDHGRSSHCRVVGGDKYLHGAVTRDLLCSDIDKAVAAVAPRVAYRIEVTALSPSRLSATLIVDGRALPEQKFAIMDHELDRASTRRFAQSLAAVVAASGKP